MAQNILVIHDGRKGHHNPSLAIAQALQTKYFFEICNYKQEQILSKRLTSVFKKASHFPWIFKLLSQLVFKTNPHNLKNTKFIVCSGMPNLVYAAFLSQRFKIPLIYAGDVRKFNDCLINWTISAMPQQLTCKQIILPTPPVLQEFIRLQSQPFTSHATLMLGGCTSEAPFQGKDFDLIITNFINFLQQKNLTGTIICSRRTPELSPQSLNSIQQNQVELKTYNTNHPITYSLTQSHYIFVTEDSVTMLAEAIHTGRVVTSICLNEIVCSGLISKYLELKLIQRKTATQITSTENKFSQIELHDMNNRIIHAIEMSTVQTIHDGFRLLPK